MGMIILTTKSPKLPRERYKKFERHSELIPVRVSLEYTVV